MFRRHALLLALSLLGTGCTPGPPPGESASSAEAKAYIRNLDLQDVTMKATQNALGSTLVEIEGGLKNNGDRSLAEVVVTCVFRDPNGQPLKREALPILRRGGEGFKPGEARRFRLPFDDIPEGWNQTLPQLVINRIAFQ